MLLDGAHLVHDALAADVRLFHIMVAADALESSDIKPLVDLAIATSGSARRPEQARTGVRSACSGAARWKYR